MAQHEETERSIKDERKESVKKAFDSPGPSAAPDPSQQQPARGTEHVGESTSRRGEDVSKKEQEPGRYSTGTDGTKAERPTGKSTQRDRGGLNPDE